MSNLAHLRIRGSLVSVKEILLLHCFQVIGVGNVFFLSKIFTKGVSYINKMSNKPTRGLCRRYVVGTYSSWSSYLALLLTWFFGVRVRRCLLVQRDALWTILSSGFHSKFGWGSLRSLGVFLPFHKNNYSQITSDWRGQHMRCTYDRGWTW